MFDFSKIKMQPSYSQQFKPAASDEQIKSLEDYCGHTLPENYKFILKNYNGGHPEAQYFEIIDKETGVPLELEIANFYILDDRKNIPDNIWWRIEKYSALIGSNAIPFATDGLQQIYFMKWANNVPEVWFLEYLDLDEPETYLIKNSFDELLEALYAV